MMNKPLSLLTLALFSLFIICNGTEYHNLDRETTLDFNSEYDYTVFHKARNKRESPPMNTTNVTDNHIYYTSKYISPGKQSDSLWFELSELIGSGGSFNNNITEAHIQNYFRYYQIWRLKFNFPFYGHTLNTVAVTTGGFLYTGTFFHEQIHLTQFIAPLLANFNPSLNESAKIYVYSTDKRFVVQWDEVHNHDHVNEGPFSFQVSIFPNGTMYFVYKEIPLPINKIDNDNHPVVVGLADSFYIDLPEGNGIVRFIYEYSRIILNATQNLANSAYIITPIRNCVIATSCQECTAITNEGNFDCGWCPALQRCSDGLDRNRQLWYINRCPSSAIKCSLSTTASPTDFISSTSSSSIIFTTQSNINYPMSSFSLLQSSLSFLISSSQNFISSSRNYILSSQNFISSQIFISPSQIFITSSIILIINSIDTTSSFLVSLTNSPSFSSSSSNKLSTPSYTFSTTSFKFSTPTIILVQPTAAPREGLPVGASVGISIFVIAMVLVVIAAFMIVLFMVYRYKRPKSELGRILSDAKGRVINSGTARYDIDGEMAIIDDTDDVEQDYLPSGTNL